MIFISLYIIKDTFTYSFEDVENEKDLDADDKITETGTNDDEDNADYQRITTIYTAITDYREELRKLQAFQRKDIRLTFHIIHWGIIFRPTLF